MIKKWIKYVFYGNPIFSFIRHKIVSALILSISTGYFLVFEIYRNEWSFFIAHEEPARSLFFTLIFFSLFTAILKGVGEWIEEKDFINRNGFRNDLILLASKLVRAKLERFKEKSPNVTQRGNIFKSITQPKDQINILLGELTRIIQDRFGLNEEQLCITIIEEDVNQSGEKIAFYAFKTQQDWGRTRAKKLLEEESTAKKCLEIGEPILHANKYKAAKQGDYFLSERDDRYSKGSVYCYPCFVKTPSNEKRYVISIVTYGKQLCYHGDEEEIDAIKEIFNEICRRLDLELTLKSMKDWQN